MISENSYDLSDTSKSSKTRRLPIAAVIAFTAVTVFWIYAMVTMPANRDQCLFWFLIGIVCIGTVFYLFYRMNYQFPASIILKFSNMPVKSILVPTHVNDQTETMRFAAQIARHSNARLAALFVIEIPHALPLDTFFPEKLLEADAVLERAQAVAREYGVAVQSHVIQSRFAGESILETAQNEECDMIVVGVPVHRTADEDASGTLNPALNHVLNASKFRVILYHSG